MSTPLTYAQRFAEEKTLDEACRALNDQREAFIRSYDELAEAHNTKVKEMTKKWAEFDSKYQVEFSVDREPTNDGRLQINGYTKFPVTTRFIEIIKGAVGVDKAFIVDTYRFMLIQGKIFESSEVYPSVKAAVGKYVDEVLIGIKPPIDIDTPVQPRELVTDDSSTRG